ncbi:MAG: hypothetical protein RIS94_1713 [Pseudomonadota bacterium]|jgi:hypothetical protein
MSETHEPFASGRCACGDIAFRLHDAPYVVHCCHCTTCQREIGSAFAVNAVIETDRLELTGGTPESVIVPSESGRGQEIVRCPSCKVAVWSHYGGVGAKAAFVRVGTLDEPERCPPSVHIFTRSALSWVVIPDGAERFEAFYGGRDIPRLYGEAGAGRFRALRGG